MSYLENCIDTQKAILYSKTGDMTSIEWHLAIEEPVSMIYNGLNFVVMMASPINLEDFGVGFSLTEGIVHKVRDIRDIEIEKQELGYLVKMAISPRQAVDLEIRKRNLESRTSCGLCGLESLNQVRKKIKKVNAKVLKVNSVEKALLTLGHHQPLRSIDHTVHGAGWCNDEGDIMWVREDVGRHSALDKLIGLLAKENINVKQGFIVLSSRCSFELVQKAAMVGIGMLATISAPTKMAVLLAKEVGMTIVTFYKNKGIVCFT